ncbi:MMPL family transporter [Kandleria sp.]|uniref:efflux RND transporter permease subunit n=1 Tax=Kandleria sp. TaxID=2774291 RepID=UPI001B53804A|nr:MMPL family transporter [Kandleria sp.]MBP3276950.1 MMPL family transporter [Kandleria sp.]
MKTFCKGVTRGRWLIIAICMILIIPSVIGYVSTKTNYDLVSYLPQDVETMKGQKILSKDFRQGAFAVIITDNMSPKQILEFEKEIKKVDSVNKVGSVYDVIGYEIPIEMLPNDIVKKVKKGQENLIITTFTESTSDDRTLNAIQKIRDLKNNIKVAGMSATTLDTAQIANSEVVIYVVIAVILCLIVLMFTLDSFFVPVLLLGNIGVAIIYNMGTNLFLGQISYITKAIAAVLQLGVTTDFSIFLYHKYEYWKKHRDNKLEAMEEAIAETLISVVGSSTTTIAGFLALCTMSLTLGTDIGLVMAKGVAFGVLTVITLFPALVLVCDKLITKTAHKSILPNLSFIKNLVVKGYKVILVLFVICMPLAYYCQSHTQSYYNLTAGLPDYLPGVQANNKLKKDFKIVSPYFIMIDSNLKASDVQEMVGKFEDLKGIDMVTSYSKLASQGFSEDMLSNEVKGMIDDGKHQMVLLSSKYDTATDELNAQIAKVNEIAKSYDKNAIVCGEGPLMKDMVNIADVDFKNVNFASTGIVFILMLLVLKSVSLPVLLVLAIEFAIYINMGIPFVMGQKIPFVASIVIGTIQLGATIDYAILMSTKYLEVRKSGASKVEAVSTAVDASVNSIFVSAMCFFAATVGVGIYSKMDMISAICSMISRGALISMVTVMLIVPSLLMAFDKIIIHSSLGFKNLKKNKEVA